MGQGEESLGIDPAMGGVVGERDAHAGERACAEDLEGETTMGEDVLDAADGLELADLEADLLSHDPRRVILGFLAVFEQPALIIENCKNQFRF